MVQFFFFWYFESAQVHLGLSCYVLWLVYILNKLCKLFWHPPQEHLKTWKTESILKLIFPIVAITEIGTLKKYTQLDSVKVISCNPYVDSSNVCLLLQRMSGVLLQANRFEEHIYTNIQHFKTTGAKTLA